MPVALVSSDGSGAPATIRDMDASGNNFIYVTARLKFTGNYPGSPGDTLDLSPITNQLPGLTLVGGFIEGNGDSTSQGGNGGYYTLSLFNGNPPVPNAVTAALVRVWTAGGAEIAASAYPAAVTRDSVSISLIFRKLTP